MAGGLLILLAFLGVNEALGAHPLWSIKIAYFGIIAGILIYSFLWVWQGSWMPKFILLAVFLAIFAGVTYLGKSRFAASFAEDAVAGSLWYFGWIAILGFAFALLMHVLAALRG